MTTEFKQAKRKERELRYLHRELPKEVESLAPFDMSIVYMAIKDSPQGVRAGEGKDHG